MQPRIRLNRFQTYKSSTTWVPGLMVANSFRIGRLGSRDGAPPPPCRASWFPRTGDRRGDRGGTPQPQEGLSQQRDQNLVVADHV